MFEKDGHLAKSLFKCNYLFISNLRKTVLIKRFPVWFDSLAFDQYTEILSENDDATT